MCARASVCTFSFTLLFLLRLGCGLNLIKSVSSKATHKANEVLHNENSQSKEEFVVPKQKEEGEHKRQRRQTKTHKTDTCIIEWVTFMRIKFSIRIISFNCQQFSLFKLKRRTKEQMNVKKSEATLFFPYIHNYIWQHFATSAVHYTNSHYFFALPFFLLVWNFQNNLLRIHLQKN